MKRHQPIRQNYFKGMYFKCSSKNHTVAFIPAFHRSNNKESASLQIITDENAFNIPFHSLICGKRPLSAKLGDCVFSEKGIKLNIQRNNLFAEGVLRFGKLSPIRYDIMGPFRFVPFMQCRHSVYSMKHSAVGRITLNEKEYVFKNGIGYIEGDCGYSFPKRYIWTQCCFDNGSLMLSAADIPMLGIHFTGIIGIVYLCGKEYRIATYLGAKVSKIGKSSVTVVQGDYRLTAKLLEKNPHPLFAPNKGNMSRTIHESASCKAYYRFEHKGKILCEFISDRASFEFEF